MVNIKINSIKKLVIKERQSTRKHKKDANKPTEEQMQLKADTNIDKGGDGNEVVTNDKDNGERIESRENQIQEEPVNEPNNLVYDSNLTTIRNIYHSPEPTLLETVNSTEYSPDEPYDPYQRLSYYSQKNG